MIIHCHVNLSFMFKHAKNTRWGIELADKCCRENVLPSVLLDMIEPSQPVDLAVNHFAHLRNWTLDHMDYAVIIRIQAIDDPPIPQAPCIVGLAAASGIEGGAIERDGHGSIIAFVHANYERIKFKQMRV